MNDKKIYVLDETVLMYDPACIYAFEDNEVLIPFCVIRALEEIQRRGENGRRRAAQEASQKLSEIFEQCGVTSSGRIAAIKTAWKDGKECEGQIRLSSYKLPRSSDFSSQVIDRDLVILSTQEEIKAKAGAGGCEVVLVSKSHTRRMTAQEVGIAAEDYRKPKVVSSNLYTGFRRMKAPLTEEKPTLSLTDISGAENLLPNELLVFQGPKGDLAYRRKRGGGYQRLYPPHRDTCPFQPKNIEQLMAMDLVFDPGVELVSLAGPAGAGKTLIALAAGIAAFRAREVDEVLWTRATVPVRGVGGDLGYLPGSKEDKFGAWARPLASALMAFKRLSGSKNVRQEEDSIQQIYGLIAEPMIYLRGDTFTNKFVIIDDAQNTTPHAMKTVITRAGEGSKIVMLGDSTQIDDPDLDADSCGLTVTADKMKQSSIFWHLMFSQVVRSRVAKESVRFL